MAKKAKSAKKSSSKAKPKAKPASNVVKIYTTPTCPYCKLAKEFFKENNVKYKEIDVSVNRQAAKEMIEKSGQMGVPVIDVNGEIVVGYDKALLKKALKL